MVSHLIFLAALSSVHSLAKYLPPWGIKLSEI